MSQTLLEPHQLKQFHVFLASPNDVLEERKAVRKFFEDFNQGIAQLWDARFEVIDFENYATVGVGRPQELITQQTLERYRNSLALVVGIMAQRFGSPAGVADSGTEEEFNWATNSFQKHGFPEIKWFFRKIDDLTVPNNMPDALAALQQWQKVREFRERMRGANNPVFYAEYTQGTFAEVFARDVTRWLVDPQGLGFLS